MMQFLPMSSFYIERLIDYRLFLHLRPETRHQGWSKSDDFLWRLNDCNHHPQVNLQVKWKHESKMQFSLSSIYGDVWMISRKITEAYLRGRFYSSSSHFQTINCSRWQVLSCPTARVNINYFCGLRTTKMLSCNDVYWIVLQLSSSLWMSFVLIMIRLPCKWSKRSYLHKLSCSYTFYFPNIKIILWQNSQTRDKIQWNKTIQCFCTLYLHQLCVI